MKIKRVGIYIVIKKFQPNSSRINRTLKGKLKNKLRTPYAR